VFTYNATFSSKAARRWRNRIRATLSRSRSRKRDVIPRKASLKGRRDAPPVFERSALSRPRIYTAASPSFHLVRVAKMKKKSGALGPFWNRRKQTRRRLRRADSGSVDRLRIVLSARFPIDFPLPYPASRWRYRFAIEKRSRRGNATRTRSRRLWLTISSLGADTQVFAWSPRNFQSIPMRDSAPWTRSRGATVTNNKMAADRER